MDQSSFLFHSFQDTTGLALGLINQMGSQIKNPECFAVQSPSAALPIAPQIQREISKGGLNPGCSSAASAASSTITTLKEESTSASASSQSSSTDFANRADSLRDIFFEGESDQFNDKNDDLEQKQADNYKQCQVLEYQSLFHADAKQLEGWINYCFDSERGTLKNRATQKDVLFHAYAANVVQYSDGLADVTFHNLLTQRNVAFCDEVAVLHSLMTHRNIQRLVNKPFLSAKKYPGNDFICTVSMKVQPKTLKNEIHYNIQVYFWPRISHSSSRILDWFITLHYPPC